MTSGLVQFQASGHHVKVGSVVEHRDHEPAARGESIRGHVDRPEPRFQLEQIDLFRIGENGDRTIGEHDVSDALAFDRADGGGPATRLGLAGEMCQERAVTEGLDQSRFHQGAVSRYD